MHGTKFDQLRCRARKAAHASLTQCAASQSVSVLY
jgi:hypothetical protein